MYFYKRCRGFVILFDARTVDGNTSVVGLRIFFATGERIHEWNTLFNPPL